MTDNFIRIPLSGILVKFLSLRPLRLCGETVFGQELFGTIWYYPIMEDLKTED